MLRVCSLQNWYAQSDPMTEESLCDSKALRRLAGIELGDDGIPDEATILNFRPLLVQMGRCLQVRQSFVTGSADTVR